jgi:hypothetical protein
MLFLVAKRQMQPKVDKTQSKVGGLLTMKNGILSRALLK